MKFSQLFLPLFAVGSAFSAPLRAPILEARQAADTIPDNWIVVLKDSVSSTGFAAHLAGLDRRITSNTKATYDLGSFKGYSGVFTQSILDILTAIPDIAYIEPDTIVRSSDLTTQSGAPWGLGRISHREPGSTDYIYDSSSGAGTYAYVIDTGIYVDHIEFQGRATFGANFVGDGLDTDGNGHGTHVSGTIGSRAYGVSKSVNLIAVKVLDSDGSGSNSDVISGIQWAANDMTAKGRKGKAVANMSLGGTYSSATNQAVAAAISAGLFMGVAAGNDGLPAALFSPASEKTACTVGASEIDDAIASYSNFGSVVDIFAPGTDILSTWIGGSNATNTISGTSMATPHIVGLAAYLTALEGSKTPDALCQRIQALSTNGALSGLVFSLGTANKLAYNGNGA